jgi:hypothetical protein
LYGHVHNGSGNPATDLTADGNKQALAIFKSKADELEKQMLSKTYVLINHNKLGFITIFKIFIIK